MMGDSEISAADMNDMNFLSIQKHLQMNKGRNKNTGFLLIINNENRRIDNSLQIILEKFHLSLGDQFWQNVIIIFTRIENFKDESKKKDHLREVFLDDFRDSFSDAITETRDSLVAKYGSENGRSSMDMTAKNFSERSFYLDAQFEPYINLLPFPLKKDIEWKILSEKHDLEIDNFAKFLKNLNQIDFDEKNGFNFNDVHTRFTSLLSNELSDPYVITKVPQIFDIGVTQGQAAETDNNLSIQLEDMKNELSQQKLNNQNLNERINQQNLENKTELHVFIFLYYPEYQSGYKDL